MCALLAGAEGGKSVHLAFNSSARTLRYTLNIKQYGAHARCTAFIHVHPAFKSCMHVWYLYISNSFPTEIGAELRYMRAVY